MLRQEESWPPPIGDAAEEENGVVIALDVGDGRLPRDHGMGRHNHENDVAIPGFDKLPVVMSGDDTFTSGPLTIPAGGPLRAGGDEFLAVAALLVHGRGNTKNLLADKGDLWGVRLGRSERLNDYYDFAPSSTQSVIGTFHQGAEGTSQPERQPGRVRAQGRPTSAIPCLPPTAVGSGISGTRSERATRRSASTVPSGFLSTGSQLNNVFYFVRVEDLAYDKRPGMGNVVYVIDSGRGRRATDIPMN